jgi:hypothetical protein
MIQLGIPSSWCLFQAIQGLVELEDFACTSLLLKARRLFDIHFLK